MYAGESTSDPDSECPSQKSPLFQFVAFSRSFWLHSSDNCAAVPFAFGDSPEDVAQCRIALNKRLAVNEDEELIR